MATPNYSYEKRQRELAKKRKLEEKKQRKAQPHRQEGAAADAAPEGTDEPAAPPPGAPAG